MISAVIWVTVLLWIIAESELIHTYTDTCCPLCNPPLLDSQSGSSSACPMTVWENYYTDVSQAAGNGGLGFQQHGWHAFNQPDWEIHWLPGVLHYISPPVSSPLFHLFIFIPFLLSHGLKFFETLPSCQNNFPSPEQNLVMGLQSRMSVLPNLLFSITMTPWLFPWLRSIVCVSMCVHLSMSVVLFCTLLTSAFFTPAVGQDIAWFNPLLCKQTHNAHTLT